MLQSFGGCILKNLWNYVKLLFLTSTFTAPTYYAVKYFKRKTFAILWIVSVFVYLINMLINFNIFTSLEPITGGTLKTKLESKLNKIGFSIDYVYHSEEGKSHDIIVSFINCYYYSRFLRLLILYTFHSYYTPLTIISVLTKKK